MHVPTPIDEDALVARKTSWANKRQKSFRDLSAKPHTSNKEADLNKNTKTAANVVTFRSAAQEKPPLAPREQNFTGKRGLDFGSAAETKMTDLLSPHSVSSIGSRSFGSARSGRSPSVKARDLLTLARQQSLPKAGSVVFSQTSLASPSSMSYGKDSSAVDISFSPKSADIMNSDVGSIDGDFPRLFTASFDGTPRKTPSLAQSQLRSMQTKDSPSVTFKKSLIKTKAKLSDDTLLRVMGVGALEELCVSEAERSLLMEDKALIGGVGSFRAAGCVGGALQINQYILLKQIGAGGFSVVFLGKNIETSESCAVKVFNKRLLAKKSFARSNPALNDLKNEIETLSTIKHPNIIDVYEVIEGPSSNKVYLVLELAAHGSTMELSPMTISDAWNYFRQLVSALHYLHEVARIVHRDIKPHNLLVNLDCVLKVSDFGTARSVQYGDELSQLAGTHAFMAPEMLSSSRPFAGKPIDMWAAGITLYYFIHGCTPFKSRKIPQLYEQIKSEEIRLPKRLEPDLQDLLNGLLCRDPVRRLTVNEVITHSWVTKKGSCLVTA
jgi:[calcium/calmodulin-dependent protein kinase] kinase